MADRIESSKLTQFVALGQPAEVISIPKLVMYVLLTPGSDGSVAATQAHVYAQKIGRG